MRTTLLALLTFVVLSLLIFGAARLVLPACGSLMGWFGPALDYCPDAAHAIDDASEGQQDRRADLLSRIARLENELSSYHCPAQATEGGPAPGEDAPDFAEDSEDQRRFEEGDNAVLEGCWQLEQSLTFENLQTGAETVFDRWQMCFDDQGQGTQRMTSRDGRVTCEGSVPGDIAQGGDLSIIEPGNLQCSDNTFIYRRDITCNIDDAGYLSCLAQQPEINRENAPFRMRRE